VPPNERGLLARLDALVAPVADRHGLALLPGGRLAAAEARGAARATGLAAPRGPNGARTRRDPTRRGGAAPAVAEGVGPLRVRGDRLPATSLRHAWAQIDESLTSAAWCQQVALTG
jgi:hypothetical protein